MYTVVTTCNSRAMKSGNALRLRKGAWDSDEDNLLRKCIEKYGEGKWHLVPQRAGLNRCRKSCRLRWLNYLSPTIRRGEFSADEMDLMIRLHRLLGNRWSLIGGRLPGRTANDVKNFWNTNVQKKLATAKEMGKREEHFRRKQENDIAPTTAGGTATIVIKPIPRTLSKGTTSLPCHNLNPTDHMIFGSPDKTLDNEDDDSNNSNNNNNKSSSQATLMETMPPNDEGMEWWKNLFAEIDIHGKEQDSLEGTGMASSSGLENMDGERGLIWETGELTAPATEANYGLPEDDWSDIWDFLNPSEDN